MRGKRLTFHGAVRYGYLAAAGVLVALVVAQVYFAGAAVLASSRFWTMHVNTGHMVSFPIYLMILLSLFGRMPGRFFLLSLALFGLYALQYVFLHLPPVELAMLRGLHAANALSIAATSTIAVRSAWRIVRE